MQLEAEERLGKIGGIAGGVFGSGILWAMDKLGIFFPGVYWGLLVISVLGFGTFAGIFAIHLFDWLTKSQKSDWSKTRIFLSAALALVVIIFVTILIVTHLPPKNNPSEQQETKTSNQSSVTTKSASSNEKDALENQVKVSSSARSAASTISTSKYYYLGTDELVSLYQAVGSVTDKSIFGKKVTYSMYHDPKMQLKGDPDRVATMKVAEAIREEAEKGHIKTYGRGQGIQKDVEIPAYAWKDIEIQIFIGRNGFVNYFVSELVIPPDRPPIEKVVNDLNAYREILVNSRQVEKIFPVAK